MTGSLARSFWVVMAMVGITGAQEWRIEEVAEGTKPELAIDRLGQPHIAFMTEALEGGVFHAVRAADGWEVEEVATGYFYGPLDLALDAAGQAHIAYHDHHSPAFNPLLGDATYVFQDGDAWAVETITHSGHDGWGTSITVSAAGDVHVASIDPAQSIPYEFGTGLALNLNGDPVVVYHDGSDQRNSGPSGSDLYLAVREDGRWSREVVDNIGDVGKFASIAIDGQGRVHIAYFEWAENNAGVVRYAVQDGDSWDTQGVAWCGEDRFSRGAAYDRNRDGQQRSTLHRLRR